MGPEGGRLWRLELPGAGLTGLRSQSKWEAKGLERGHPGSQPSALALSSLALVLGEQLSSQRWRRGETGAPGPGEDPHGHSGTSQGR